MVPHSCKYGTGKCEEDINIKRRIARSHHESK